MEAIRELNIWSVIIRVLLSLIVGGLLGMERGRKNRPAGFRTYMLVCFGSAMVMMTNQYAFQFFQNTDPVRMGAQVISGVGFLGAGTIIMTNRNHVKGITTAAGLWAAACSGLAIGVGFYEGAIISGITIYLVLSGMQYVDKLIRNRSKMIDLYIEYSQGLEFSHFLKYAREHSFDIFDVQISRSAPGVDSVMCFTISAKTLIRRTHAEMTEVLGNAPGVTFIEEV
ncbi:MAG: MgtC/SapB family protein [Christensenellales bacterium]